jgi:hypothetical protein
MFTSLHLLHRGVDMKKLFLVFLIMIVSACSPSTPVTPPVIQDLNLEGSVFVKVDYLSAPEEWQSKNLMLSESVNILRTLTLEPLKVSEIDLSLSPWLVLYTQDNKYIVARTNDTLFVKDEAANLWYTSSNTAFDTLFGWIYPDYRFMIDRFETLMVKGAVSEEYKSLLLDDDNNNVISTLLNDSNWTPHLQRFDQVLWYDAIITMNNGETLYILEDTLGSLLWVVNEDGKSHGYVLEGYVLSRLISEMLPSFLMQYFRDPLIEAELRPEEFEDDGLLVELDETISNEILENIRMDEWSIATDIPAMGLMVDLILYDEVFAYVFAPYGELDLIMIRNNILQTNDFYFTPPGLGMELRTRIETYLGITPVNP